MTFEKGHEKVVQLLLEQDAGDPYKASDGQESMIEKAIFQKWSKLGHFIFWKKKGTAEETLIITFSRFLHWMG